MPVPAVADRRGQIAKVELLPQFCLLFLQPRELAGERATLAGQAGVGVGVRLLLFDLPADLLPLVHELRDLARAPVPVEDLVPRRFQIPGDVDQRDAIQAGGDAIQHVGRLGVAESGQFLHLAEADGKDVVERRLVDAGQQRLHHLFAVPNAVGGSNQRFVQPWVAVGRRVAGDLKLPAGPAHFKPSARSAAVEWRQIAVPIGRKTVKDRANEMEKRRLARFVRAVDDIQTLAHALELQSAPDAIAFDFQGKKFHVRWFANVL